MANIKKDFNSGGSAGGSGIGTTKRPTITGALRDVADDLETFRVAFNALTTKLNADAGVTDTNYATISTGSIKTKKV